MDQDKEQTERPATGPSRLPSESRLQFPRGAAVDQPPAERPQSDRPQGDRPAYGGGGDRPSYGDRPRGDRPYGGGGGGGYGDRDRGDRGGSGGRGGEGRDRDAGGMGGRGRPRRFGRGKVCLFCVQKMKHIDYKDLDLMRRFLTDRGKILPRRITGVCAGHQRALTTTIKRARNIALIPYKAK